MKRNPRLLDPGSYRYGFDMSPRFSDVDLQNHLNNVRIGELYQEGRVTFFAQLLREQSLQRAEGLRVLIAHIAIDYLAEISYPQLVTVKLGVAKLGRTSIALQMALFSEGRCAGLARVVVVNADEQGSVPIPEDWRAALSQYLLQGDVIEQ